MITEDWVVSIRGRKMINCVSAMSVLINSITEKLNSPVAVDLLTYESGNGESLHLLLKRQERKERIVNAIKYVVTIALSAVSGALLQWWLSGGL